MTSPAALGVVVVVQDIEHHPHLAKRSVPSAVFNATFPVNPSVTMTSAGQSSRSRPSMLPMKRTPGDPGRPGARGSPSRGACPSWAPHRSSKSAVWPDRRCRSGSAAETPRPSGRTGRAWPGCTRRWPPHRPAPPATFRGAASGWRYRAGPPWAGGPCGTGPRPSWRRCCRPTPWPTPCRRGPARPARTSEESFLRRTPEAGSSAIPMTSVQGTRSRPWVSPTSSGGPTKITGTPSSAARRAPATISSGALSPPIAPRATGSSGERLCRGPLAVTGQVSRPRPPSGPCTTRSWGTPRGAPSPSLQWGQMLRGGTARAATAERLHGLRPLALDVFFLGTAIVGLQARWIGRPGRAAAGPLPACRRPKTQPSGASGDGPEHVEASPTGVLRCHAGTLLLVAVDPAPRAQPWCSPHEHRGRQRQLAEHRLRARAARGSMASSTIGYASSSSGSPRRRRVAEALLDRHLEARRPPAAVQRRHTPTHGARHRPRSP